MSATKRHWNYVGDHGDVQLKGRVACQFRGGNELLLTEMLLSAAFKKLQPAEVCAVLSSLVFQSQVENETELIEKLPAGDKNRQTILDKLRQIDGFNWGYDPVHYQALENTYSSSDNGIDTIIEFKRAINHIKSMGLRVSLDVVFNHTYESGLKKFSVLDKIVPNYYHRRDRVSGKIYTSSCCENTASKVLGNIDLATAGKHLFFL